MNLTVQQLALSRIGGEDCEFALRDALLEAGFHKIAEHFVHEDHNRDNPNACPMVFLLAGRDWDIRGRVYCNEYREELTKYGEMMGFILP